MVLALASSPTYPVTGEVITLSLTGSSKADVAFELTAAPASSLIGNGILAISGLESGQAVSTAEDDLPSFLQSKQVTSADNYILNASALAVSNANRLGNEFTADKPGQYTFSVYEIQDHLSAPSFPGDPTAEARRLVSSVGSFSLDVGELVTLPIRNARGRGADLRLTVVGNTVRSASLVNHTDAGALTGGRTTAMTAALTALEGVTVDAIGIDLLTGVDELRTKYELHRVDTTGGTAVHAVADTINTFPPDRSYSQQDAISQLNVFRQTFIAHALLTLPELEVHADDDRLNLPDTNRAGTVAEATVLLADMRRVYTAHLAQVAGPPSVHGSAGSHALTTAVTVLETAITTLLGELSDDTPTVPTNEPEGITKAVQIYGFTHG